MFSIRIGSCSNVLQSFVADRIFDSHCHLYDAAQFLADIPALIQHVNAGKMLREGKSLPCR